MSTRTKIGILALQGGYEAHANVLRALGADAVLVKRPDDLVGLAGMVFPGGESSTMLKLIDWSGLWEPLDVFVRSGKPVLATCAGLILAARHVTGPEQRSFGWLDVDVARNAWGRQVESFEAQDDQGTTDLVFIRAPRITRVGLEVEVLATLRGEPVAVRAGAIVGASFHPELTANSRYHHALVRTIDHPQSAMT